MTLKVMSHLILNGELCKWKKAALVWPASNIFKRKDAFQHKFSKCIYLGVCWFEWKTLKSLAFIVRGDKGACRRHRFDIQV